MWQDWMIIPIAAVILLMAIFGLAKGLGGSWKEMAKKRKDRKHDEDDDNDRD